MDDASHEPDVMIAELARAMTPDRRGRFLDAACGGDDALRAAVEARLGTGPSATAAPAEVDGFESLALEAVSATLELPQESDELAGGGTPILDSPQGRSPEPIVRLRLFQEVCRLIDREHRLGRIDGSLTPARIRVRHDGEVQVVSRELADGDVANPRYASPEKILGEPLTTATDVYGLGVVLYELLTGHYPYRTTSSTPGPNELFQAISEQAPERPSEVAARQAADAAAKGEESSAPKAMRKLLEADLDLIVLKALQKEPDRRYSSLAALADDLDRFLSGRPVLAHPPGRAYVAGKFLRRHPVLIVLGAVAALGLITALAATSLALVRSRRAAAQSEAAYLAAREAVDQLFARVDREPALAAPDLQPARSALLESFLRYYERAADQPGGELETRIESARTRHRIGRIYERLGLFEVASWQYAEALAAFDDLEKNTPGQRFPEERAELLGTLGELLRSQPLRRAEARAQLEQAMDLLKDAATPKAPLPRRRLLAKVLGSLAELEQAEEHPEQAADAWQQAVAIHEAIVGGSSATSEDRAALASSLIGLGRVLATVPATTAPGLAAMARGVELRQAVVRAGPSMPDQAHELARNLSELAHIHQTLGQTGLAVDHARRAVEVYEQLDRRFPDTVAYQMGLYLAYDRLSRLLGMRNETKLALERSIQARGVLERLVSGHPKDKIFVLDLAHCHSLIGRLHQRRRAYLDALASFQKAVDLLESVAGLDGESSYQLAVNLSLCVSLLGASDEAPPPDDEAALNPANRLRRQVYGKRAVVALEQAFSKGLANPEPYRSDSDLDPLRDRPDFQTLLRKIDDKTKARNAESR